MEKDTPRYASKRIDIESLLEREDSRLNLDNLLGSPEAPGKQQTTGYRRREVRHISPGEYIVIIMMVITSLYLLVTSFFPLMYNIATSFEPINFLMNLFYFVLGIGVLAGAFLVFKKETHLEHIADDTFDEVIYKRLEPVLRDVAVVQVGLSDVHNKLEMMNLNIEKIGKVRETAAPESPSVVAPIQMSMYVKYVVLINITLAVFLFMLQYPMEYIPYAVTIVYIIWWATITAEFKLWNVESVWMWVFVPILVLPVYSIIMNAYLRDYQMFGSLFLGLCAYILLYYFWCSNMVRGTLPLDLHIALQEFKNKLEEKTKSEVSKPKTPRMPRIELKMSFNIYQLAVPMIIGAMVLFAIAWFGFSIQRGLIPNVAWSDLGLEQFAWESLYSYALTVAGIIFLGAGIILRLRRGHD